MPNVPHNGQKRVVTAGAPESITGTSRVVKSVLIVALDGNADKVGVGGVDTPDAAAATQNCALLAPGDALPFGNVDLAEVFLDVRTNNDGVAWISEE